MPHRPVARNDLASAIGLVAGLLALTLACGCAVGPNYKPPPTTMPDAWYNTPASPDAAATQQAGPATSTTAAVTLRNSMAVQGAPQLARWWENFNDPELNALVARAIAANLDLRQAESRIRQARAARAAVAATLFPQVTANGSYTRSRTPGDPTEQLPATVADAWQAGLDATWEIDIFGGTRRNVEASEADLRAAVEDRRDVLVTLLGEVALNYVELRGFQQEIRIAKENLAAQQQSADVTRKRKVGGIAAGLDVANADADVATTAATIPVFEQSADQTIYALSILIAQPPGALGPELKTEVPIPTTPPLVPVGLPSDLLRRRPDIRRAEEQLHAATARIGVAVANLFPHFFLNGSGGTEAANFPGLANWGNRFWSVGPSVTWDVFDAGQVWAQVQVQNELEQQALLTYHQAVLSALQDVENALVAYAKEQQHRAALADAVVANRRAVDISTQLYREGLTDFLNVLVAQKSLFASEDALVQSEETVSTNLVAVYKALGGGWEFETQAQANALPTR
jgi:outer membrane protein, multidrug efflux system